MLGALTPGLLFRGGRGGLYFLLRGCVVCVVSVYSRCAIRGGDNKRLIYPRRFPINVEWYREDGCVFVLRVRSVELIGDESIVYVSAELLRS